MLKEALIEEPSSINAPARPSELLSEPTPSNPALKRKSDSLQNINLLFQPPKLSLRFSTPVGTVKRRQKNRQIPVDTKTTAELKTARAVLSTLLALCDHGAWETLATFSNHNKPDGVYAIQQELKKIMENNLDDHTVVNAFESIKNTCTKQLNRFSLTRSNETNQFYSMIASIASIREDAVDTQIKTLDRKLKLFNDLLDQRYQQYHANKHSSLLSCCFGF